jgi:hypothetical protein
MRKFKLVALAALALFAFGAVAASTAFGVEEPNNPRLLVLEGKASEIKGTLKGGEFRWEDLAGKTIEGKAAELLVEGCTIISEAEAKDTNLCKDVPFHLTGFRKGVVACRSETLAKVKDPIETILALLDVHLAAGLNLPTNDNLVPIFTAQILGVDLAEDLEINCGGVLVKVLGTLACAAGPGLENTKKLEISCKINAATHDAEKPDCTVLCEDVGVIGVKSTFGVEPNDAWESFTLSGELNKDFFIDD